MTSSHCFNDAHAQRIHATLKACGISVQYLRSLPTHSTNVLIAMWWLRCVTLRFFDQAEPKVGNLEFSVTTHQQVITLQITMHNAATMEIREPQGRFMQFSPFLVLISGSQIWLQLPMRRLLAHERLLVLQMTCAQQSLNQISASRVKTA